MWPKYPIVGRLVGGERVERRLAAVLAADVAGYSRLMGADEQAVEQFHYAKLLNPLDLRNYTSECGIAWANFFLRRFEVALSWAKKSMARQKNYRPALRMTTATYAMRVLLMCR